MTLATDVIAYHVDLSDELYRLRFAEDFADWLMDHRREEEAREFLHLVKTYEESTEEYDLEDVIAIAEGFNPIVDVNEEMAGGRNASDLAIQILEEQEGNLRWDQEAALINQYIRDSEPVSAVPRDLLEPEFPNVDVYFDLNRPIVRNVLGIPFHLAAHGHHRGARAFIQDMKALLRTKPTNYALFQLAWSYVMIYPDPDQYGQDDW